MRTKVGRYDMPRKPSPGPTMGLGQPVLRLRQAEPRAIVGCGIATSKLARGSEKFLGLKLGFCRFSHFCGY